MLTLRAPFGSDFICCTWSQTHVFSSDISGLQCKAHGVLVSYCIGFKEEQAVFLVAQTFLEQLKDLCNFS